VYVEYTHILLIMYIVYVFFMYVYYYITFRYLLLPDQKDTACDVNWPSKRDIWCGHSRVIWDLVQPHQSHDSRLDMTGIQSTEVPVLAFCRIIEKVQNYIKIKIKKEIVIYIYFKLIKYPKNLKNVAFMSLQFSLLYIYIYIKSA